MDSIISIKEMSRAEIESVLERASEIEGSGSELSEKVLALLFFEPSTRTRMSFDTAVKRLGGRSIDLGSVESSSVKKGETLADTVRVIEGYADAIVIRHPKEGSARLASEFVDVPVINAGDGTGQHPTQTLLDLYTMRQNSGLEDLTVGILGDLKYGRTVHSLALALTKFDVTMKFISPPQLRLPERVRFDLDNSDADFEETESLEGVIDELDVLYATRIQEERFPDESEYRKVSDSYQITPETLESAKDGLGLMHPLPRVDEITPEVDSMPQAKYFEQAHNGVEVRMAILDLVLGGD
ncbi:MAG: aspartate carbamoyltransferase [Halobacteria archaeon]|nr:aspartate carbamoyltransferase [Halobacteria archaeon]